MEEYRSIKEIIDAFHPDMEYSRASKGNLRLSRCPFCGGKKAYINPDPRVNGFSCFSGKCSKQLTFMALYKELSGQTDARYVDIVTFLDGHIPEGKAYEQVMPKVHEEERAPLADRDAVYSRLLELLTLDDDDKASLMKRGLTEEQIEWLGYKSCPTKEQIPKIVETLQAEKFCLKGIPGFYKRYGKYSMMLANGFFIPFRNMDGEIQGLQIRRKGDENITLVKDVSFSNTVDYTLQVKNNNPFPINLRIIDEIPDGAKVKSDSNNVPFDHVQPKEIRWELYFKAGEEKILTYSLEMDIPRKTKAKVVVQPRYIWFSSGNREGGTPMTNFTHHIGDLRDVMYLTEGGLKADVTYFLCGGKKSFLAVTGITSLRDMPKTFEYFKKNGVKEVCVAFDMDRVYNERVMEAIENVQRMAEDAGLQSSVLEWDIKMGKGIDDFTLAHLKSINKI